MAVEKTSSDHWRAPYGTLSEDELSSWAVARKSAWFSYHRESMTYLLFATALALSAVAAYYSIMGLVAIFAAAALPIFIMGSLLEVSKLVVASWLYRSWREIPFLMKSYFTVALVVLMMLTSMGIFGFLSKAHLDQAVPTGDVSAKLALIDEKIKTEKENLNANRAELNQLDSQVNETISRSGNSTNNGANNRMGCRHRPAFEAGYSQPASGC